MTTTKGQATIKVAVGALSVPDQGTLRLSGAWLVFRTWGFVPTINSEGDKCMPRHIVEGLLLCLQHKRGALEMSGVPPSLAKNTLRTDAMIDICKTFENDPLFQPEAYYATVGEVAGFYEKVGRQRIGVAEYCLDGNALRKFQNMTLPCAVENEFCNSINFSGRDSECQLAEVGSAILLFGPRSTDHARWDPCGQFRVSTDFYRHCVEEMFPHAKIAAAQGTLFFHAYAAIGPPTMLRPIPTSGDAVIGEITQRMLYWKAKNEAARLDVLCASYDATSFKWPSLHEVALTFGKGNRSFVAVRSLLKAISTKIEVDDAVDMLNEGEIVMHGRHAHVTVRVRIRIRMWLGVVLLDLRRRLHICNKEGD